MSYSELEPATWRDEFASFARNWRTNERPWWYVRMCLRSWTSRAVQDITAFLLRKPRPRFVFIMADVHAAMKEHPTWDLARYLPEWSKPTEERP